MCVGRRSSANDSLVEHKIDAKNFGKIVSLIGQPADTKEIHTKEFKEDALAIMTQQTKHLFQWINDQYQKFLTSVFYKILFYTTQPAHLITALSVLYIAFLCFPNKNQTPTSPLWNLIYLMSFSTHFGAQIWMTFVSGLSLYFSLPRHMFGNVQKVLFPKYFLLNAVLSFITLAIFFRSKNHDLLLMENAIQASGMLVCFLIELVIRLYLTPPLLSSLTEKTTMEKQAGVGMEVGKFTLGELRQCPHYLSVHQRFRKIHSSIAMLNIVTMACTVLHLYYLSHKMCNL